MTYPKDARWQYKLAWILVWVFHRFFVRLKVEGTENIPQSQGCVAACNHTMGPDYFFLGLGSPRQVFFMAKAELFRWQPLAQFLAGAGTFAVRRGEQDRAALQRAIELVENGKIIGMFPEGTRSRTGTLMRGRSGAARIALAAGAPVIPVAIEYEGHWIRQGLLRLRRVAVIVRFGKPIWGDSETVNGEEARALTDRVMGAIADMLPPEVRGVYASTSDTQE